MSKAIITISDEVSDTGVTLRVDFEGESNSSVEKLAKVTIEVLQEMAALSGDFEPFIPTPIPCGRRKDENRRGN